MRVVSLLPSLTEIVCALGARDTLVARSHECDFPEGLGPLPVLTAAKLDATAPSAEIDARVRELVTNGLSVYRVDAEALRDAAPELVLTQEHCEVGAASLGDVETALQSWTGARPRVVSVAPTDLAGVWRSIQTVADALGRAEAGEALLASLTDRVTTIGEERGAAERPRVLCVEWSEPLMSAGNWIPELVAIAGGTPLLAQAGAHSPWLEPDALAQSEADCVIVMPCGYDLERTRAELPILEALPGWSALPAVQRGRVAVVDGNQYFNRPGPRLVESLEILCEILSPDRADFGHAGRGWEWA